MTSTTGTRLYLVYYGLPITFYAPEIPDRPPTRGHASAPTTMYNVSAEQIRAAKKCHEDVQTWLKETKWQLRKHNGFGTIDLEWKDCTEKDMQIMEKDCPDNAAMQSLYPFLHLNTAKMQIPSTTLLPPDFAADESEWRFGSVFFGENLADKFCNFVLLSDTQFRCLNGLILSKNCQNACGGTFSWQFHKEGWDAHGIVDAKPIQIATARYNWSRDLDASVKNLKFNKTEESTAQLNTETGEREIHSSGQLSVKVGKTSADLKYATVKGKAPLFAVNGMCMVSLIELPTVESTVQKTYNYGIACIFCLTNPATYRADPCNHYFVCGECVGKIPSHVKRTCPMCRAPTKQIVAEKSEEQEESLESFKPEVSLESFKPLTLETLGINLMVELRIDKDDQNPRLINHTDFSKPKKNVIRVTYSVPPEDLIDVHFTNLLPQDENDYGAEELTFKYCYVSKWSAAQKEWCNVEWEEDIETAPVGNTFTAAYPLQKDKDEDIDGWIFYFYPNLEACSTDADKTEFSEKLEVIFEEKKEMSVMRIDSTHTSQVFVDGIDRSMSIDFYNKLYL